MTTAARDALILESVPLVRFHARTIHRRLPKQVEFEDIVSAGMVGLIEAVDRYQSTPGIPFRTYARRRVRGAIFDWLRTSSRLSRRQMEKNKVGEHTVTYCSLDAPLSHEERGTLLDVIPGEDGTAAYTHTLAGDVRRAIHELPERQQKVIYATVWGETLLSDIASELEISPTRAAQLRSQAIRTLQTALHA